MITKEHMELSFVYILSAVVLSILFSDILKGMLGAAFLSAGYYEVSIKKNRTQKEIHHDP